MRKMNDSEMGLVTGGSLAEVCAGVVLVSIPLSLVTSAAALGCYIKSQSLSRAGDELDAQRYSSATKGLMIASTALTGAGTLVTIGGAVSGDL